MPSKAEQYAEAWKLLLERPLNKEGRKTISIRCFTGLSSTTLIKALHNEKSKDKENNKKYMLQAKKVSGEKGVVVFTLRRKINILEV